MNYHHPTHAFLVFQDIEYEGSTFLGMRSGFERAKQLAHSGLGPRPLSFVTARVLAVPKNTEEYDVTDALLVYDTDGRPAPPLVEAMVGNRATLGLPE